MIGQGATVSGFFARKLEIARIHASPDEFL